MRTHTVWERKAAREGGEQRVNAAPAMLAATAVRACVIIIIIIIIGDSYAETGLV